MNQVMPTCSVVMIIHVVLLDWVMNIFQRSECEPSDVNVHCGHDYSSRSAGLCDEFQRSEYEPSDANIHCGHDYSCCSAGLCDEFQRSEYEPSDLPCPLWS